MALSGVRRVARNAASLMTTDIVTRGTTFVMYVLIARQLGSREFGQIALALNLFHLFHILSVLGLRNFITREVARDREITGKYLLNGSVVVFGSSLLAIGMAYVFVTVMRYATDTSFIIMLLALGLIPYALSIICEAVFRAWERMHYIAYTYVTANLTKLAAVVLLLYLGRGLVEVALVLLATRIVTLLLQWWLMAKNVVAPGLRIDFKFCTSMLSRSVTFMGLESAQVIRSSFNTILLSKFGGEVAVGLYSAAMQIRLPITIVFVSVATSVFPVMCRRVKGGVQNLKVISETLVGLLLAIALPAAAGLFLLSESALFLLYDDAEFFLASPALRIIAWTVIAAALTAALGQVLLASHHEKTNLRIVLTNSALSLIFGFWFVSQYGIVGAASSAVLVSTANLVQHYIPVARILSGHRLFSLLWQPLLATAVMAAYIVAVGDQNFFLVVASAIGVYGFALAIVAIVSAGGVQALKNRYRDLLAT